MTSNFLQHFTIQKKLLLATFDVTQPIWVGWKSIAFLNQGNNNTVEQKCVHIPLYISGLFCSQHSIPMYMYIVVVYTQKQTEKNSFSHCRHCYDTNIEIEMKINFLWFSFYIVVFGISYRYKRCRKKMKVSRLLVVSIDDFPFNSYRKCK